MPAKPDRAPMHTDDAGQPVTNRRARGRRVPVTVMTPPPAGSGRGMVEHQPANGGRFAPTADFSEASRREATASRQPANGERFAPTAKLQEHQAWADMVHVLRTRAADNAATSTGPGPAAVWQIVADWLRDQADMPPR